VHGSVFLQAVLSVLANKYKCYQAAQFGPDVSWEVNSYTVQHWPCVYGPAALSGVWLADELEVSCCCLIHWVWYFF